MFHFLKGRDLGLNTALFPRVLLDVLVPLFFLGCWQIFANRIFNRGDDSGARNRRGRVRILRRAESDRMGTQLSRGAALRRDRRGSRRDSSDTRRPDFTATSGRCWRAAAALILISLIWIAPLINENWLHGAIYGFGFVPRAEISRLADALRAASKPTDDVIAPSFVCFEANRRELIRYPETYGVYREAKAEYDRDGFFIARRHLGTTDFFQLITDSRHFWTDQMRDAIASGKVSAVISDSPIQLLPLVLVPDDFLTSNGFRPALITDHFTLWTRSPAP